MKNSDDLTKYSQEAEQKLAGMVLQTGRNMPPRLVPYTFLYTATVAGIVGLAAAKAELLPYAVLGALSVGYTVVFYIFSKQKS